MKTPDTIYHGERVYDTSGRAIAVRVTCNGKPLDPRPAWKLRCHSSTGYEWGYSGSGPAQLALALVLDATGDPEWAERCYQWFKRAIVAGWGDRWEITAGEIFACLDRYEASVEYHDRYAREHADTPIVIPRPEGGAP